MTPKNLLRRTSASTPVQGARPGASFLQGLLTNLSNPKSVVYFGSVFTVFMRPGVPAWVEGAAVAIVLFDTVVWYGSVAALFSRGAVRRVYGTVRGRVNRAAGAAMAVFGARLVLARE